MDVETVEAIAALGHEVHATFATKAELKDEIGKVRGDILELRGEMQDMGTAIRTEMQDMGTALRTEMQENSTAIRGDMQEMRAELRQHMLVLVEGLHDDIRRVADGVVGPTPRRRLPRKKK